MSIAVKEREEVKVEALKKAPKKEERYPDFFEREVESFSPLKGMPNYIGFLRSCNSSLYEVFYMWSDFSFKMWDTLIDQTMHAQKEGREIFNGWMENCHMISREYQKMGEKNFDSLSSLFK